MISQDLERKKNMEAKKRGRQEEKKNGECGVYRKSASDSGMINVALQSCFWGAVRGLSQSSTAM